MKKPLIGVVLDYKNGSENNDYSIRPYYAIRKNYIDAINQSGAIAVLFPYDKNAIEHYLQMIDGLMIVGGNFDINPKRYGDAEIHPTTTLNEIREDFEYEILSRALKTKLPILGICNGMQLINVLRGGDIMQNITDDKNFINHEQSKILGKEDSSKAYHDVKINSESKLYQIVDTDKIPTNSSHHQAVKNIGNGLKISAYAEDGIIEALEDPLHDFCLGIQWHPEFIISESDKKIFQAFVVAATKYQNSIS